MNKKNNCIKLYKTLKIKLEYYQKLITLFEKEIDEDINKKASMRIFKIEKKENNNSKNNKINLREINKLEESIIKLEIILKKFLTF